MTSEHGYTVEQLFTADAAQAAVITSFSGVIEECLMASDVRSRICKDSETPKRVQNGLREVSLSPRGFWKLPIVGFLPWSDFDWIRFHLHNEDQRMLERWD